MRNLILAGGIFHPFDDTAPQLSHLLGPAGFESEISFDIEAGLERLAHEKFQLLTVHCLRWTMTQHAKYEPYRAQWALSLSPAGRRAIEQHLAAGGGLLGLHTASICFDDWPAWGNLLGAAWRWERSHHPPMDRIDVRPAGRHPIIAGLAPFAVVDELYQELELSPDIEVIAEGRLVGTDSWKPVGMVKQTGRGRSVYLSLGHDVASLDEPQHAKLIARAARWAAGVPAEMPDQKVVGA
jgi:type 1 glutamine amidotransferase